MNNKQISQSTGAMNAEEAYDYLLVLSHITVRFARVMREPRYPDGATESDVEHSFHLGITATELASTYFPDLNAGLVAQFSLVHDLPELYAGDTPSFNLSDEERAKKEQNEKAASTRLSRELPPYTAKLLERYERQEEPEARFVRLIDKILPIIMMVVAGDACTFKEDFNVTSLASLSEVRAKEVTKLHDMFPEFPFIHMVRSLVVERADATLFPEET
jgi:5'-deoxynucleotidase YfbR-like HD superfamily hydrolase